MNPPMRFWSCLSSTGLIQCHPYPSTLQYVLKHRFHFIRGRSTLSDGINPKYRPSQHEPPHEGDLTVPQFSIRRLQTSPVEVAKFPFNDEFERRALRRELRDLVEKPVGSYERKWALGQTGRDIEKLFIFEHPQKSLEFIVQIFKEAERRSHKTHLSNAGAKVTVRWLTSSEILEGIHGLTWKDIKMAQFCDRTANSIKLKDFQENYNIVQKQSRDLTADIGSLLETKQESTNIVIRKVVTEDKTAADEMAKMVDKQAKEKELLLKSIEDRKRVVQDETDAERFRLEMGLGFRATEATKEITDRKPKDFERVKVLEARIKSEAMIERKSMKETVTTQHVARWIRKHEKNDPTWKSEKVKQLEATSDPKTETAQELFEGVKGLEPSDRHYYSKVRHAEERLQLKHKKLLAMERFIKKPDKDPESMDRPLKKRSRRQAFNSRRQIELAQGPVRRG